MGRTRVLFCGAIVQGRVCGKRQRSTYGGLVCEDGHGGADSITRRDLDTIEELGRMKETDNAGLIARDGDVLTVEYRGAKISIGNYSTVEVDGAILQRPLCEGESIQQQYATAYKQLQEMCEGQAREKIAYYSREVSKGRKP